MSFSPPGGDDPRPIYPAWFSARRRSRPRRRAMALLLFAAVIAAGAGTAILAVGQPAGPGAQPPATGTPGSLGAGSPSGPLPSPTPAAAITLPPLLPAQSPPPTDAPPAVPEPKQAPPTSAPPEELTGYVWPIRDARITSRFGPRDFGGFVLIDGKEIHDGLDLATFCGNKVRAAHDGTVLYAGRRFDDYMGYLGSGSAVHRRLEQQGRLNTLPKVVVIDDGNGYRSVYVHLSDFTVEAGQVVSAGEVIGFEGATGFATGCHLHYSLIRMDGPWQVVVPQLRPYGYPPFARERVDPLKVLPRDHPDAPVRLRERFASPTPTTGPNPGRSPSLPGTSSPVPSPAPSPTLSPSVTPSAVPTGTP